MKLVIFNGSPRYKKSNSAILTEHFLKGHSLFCSEPVPVYYIANYKQREAAAQIVEDADTVLVIFPLYTDCMPGIVKEFFEILAAHKYSSAKQLGFIVQSGFPESIHSMGLERYLEKLTHRLQFDYLGTVIKGGVEGIQIMPPAMTKKLYGQFEMLGAHFAQHTAFEPTLVTQLRKPYRFSKTYAWVFNLLSKTGITNFYWNSNLKKNGAFEQRFDRPYRN